MAQENHTDHIPPPGSRTPCLLCTVLMVWMIGVMVLSWVLFDGPVVSSLAKRIGVLRCVRDALVTFMGG